MPKTEREYEGGQMLMLDLEHPRGPIIRMKLTNARWYEWLWWADVFLGRIPLLKVLLVFLVAILVGVWR